MPALWSNNFIIAFVRKNKFAVLISLLIIGIAYNDDNFKIRPVAEINFDLNGIGEGIIRFFGDDILKAISPLVCTISPCQGESAK